MPPVPGCTHLPVSIPREMGPFQETRLLGSPGGRSVPRGEQQLLGRRRSINRSSSGGDNACLPSISLTQSLHAHIRGTSWRFRGCRRVDGLGTIPNLAIGASFPGYLVSSNNGEKWAGGSITHYLPIRSTVLRSVRRYETILLPRNLRRDRGPNLLVVQIRPSALRSVERWSGYRSGFRVTFIRVVSVDP